MALAPFIFFGEYGKGSRQSRCLITSATSFQTGFTAISNLTDAALAIRQRERLGLRFLHSLRSVEMTEPCIVIPSGDRQAEVEESYW